MPMFYDLEKWLEQQPEVSLCDVLSAPLRISDRIQQSLQNYRLLAQPPPLGSATYRLRQNGKKRDCRRS